MKEKKINSHSLPIALEEANELLNHAIEIDNGIQKILKRRHNSPLGKMITANVLVGLSIEIYLKCFMIAGRQSGVIQGHKLAELYSDFPSFLKSAIELEYKHVGKNKNVAMVDIGIMTSNKEPSKPTKEPFDGIDFTDFESSLNAISNTFVESRYFFETINKSEWSFIKYPFEVAKSIALTLKKVFKDYQQGKFRGS